MKLRGQVRRAVRAEADRIDGAPDKGVLLDTRVVVRHFRDAKALASNFAAYEELYLPQTALAQLYAGAYPSKWPGKNLQQIEQFLEAVDGLLPDESTP